MAVTAADVTALQEAIASGVLSVSQSGKVITYRTLAEMMRALAFAKLEVNGTTNRNKRVTLARPTRRRR